MKHTILYCAWFIFTMAITSGCNNNNPKPPVQEELPSAVKPGAQLSAADTWKQIDSCYARRMFLNFDTMIREPFEASHPGIGIPGNIWYDASLILNLADRIKANGYSGIRIYFGAYDRGMGIRSQTKYAMAPTIFIVETRLINGQHRDQFSGQCITGNFYDAYNHGHLCPPDPAEQCNGAAFDERNIP